MNVLGGEVNWRLRTPEEFATATRFVRPEDMQEAVWTSSGLGRHAERLAEPGFDETHLHQVGSDQRAFGGAGAARLRRRRGRARAAPGDRTFS